MSKASDDYDIDTWQHVSSALGNGYFSGVSMETMWEAVKQSSNREEFDAAIAGSVKIEDIKKAMDR